VFTAGGGENGWPQWCKEKEMATADLMASGLPLKTMMTAIVSRRKVKEVAGTAVGRENGGAMIKCRHSTCGGGEWHGQGGGRVHVV
jgi:hypothetical protein